MDPHRAVSPQQKYLWDILIVIFLGSVAGVIGFLGTAVIDPVVFERQASSLWFQGDLHRIFELLESRLSSQHYRSEVHPLFSLFAFPPVLLLRKLGVPFEVAIQLVTSMVAVGWMATLYALLRIMGCRRPDAAIYGLLGTCSASTMFWVSVPETYVYGSLSILLALIVVAVADRRHVAPWLFAVSSALTLSFTTTNWMAGIGSVFTTQRRRRAIIITLSALAGVLVFWGIQKTMFPQVKFPLPPLGETRFLLPDEAGGAPTILKAYFLHSMIMPDINVIQVHAVPHWPIMSVQHSSPGSASGWGTVGVFVWVALLVLGLYGLRTTRHQQALRKLLGLLILGQLLLHLLYGEETFLYSLHYGPLLVVAAAFGVFTRLRKLSLALAIVLVICAGVNNIQQFRAAHALFESSSPTEQTQSMNRGPVQRSGSLSVPGAHGKAVTPIIESRIAGALLKGEADFHSHLPMSDPAVIDGTARVDNLEPSHVSNTRIRL